MIRLDERRPVEQAVEDDSERYRDESEQDDDEHDVPEREAPRHQMQGVDWTDEAGDAETGTDRRAFDPKDACERSEDGRIGEYGQHHDWTTDEVRHLNLR